MSYTFPVLQKANLTSYFGNPWEILHLPQDKKIVI